MNIINGASISIVLINNGLFDKFQKELRNASLSLISALLLIIPMNGCNVQNTIGGRNLSRFYFDEGPENKIKTEVYYQNDSLATIYFQTPINSNLVFDSLGSKELSVKFLFYKTYEDKFPVDSIEKRITFEQNPDDQKIIGKLEFVNHGKQALIGFGYFNTLSGLIGSTGFFMIDPPGYNFRQSFLITSETMESPLFRNYIKSEEQVKIFSRIKPGKLFVSVYQRDFPLALPPFSYSETAPFDLRPDTIFILEPAGNGVYFFSCSKSGVYHIQVDTFQRQGLTIFNFGSHFPEISGIEKMAEPIRFITSRQEFESIKNASDKKQIMDEFWLDIAGNPSRGKVLISAFYNRVKNANLLFSAHLEGWKTDRGMIYLIFGKPDVITRNENYETWIYGEVNNLSSLSFNFTKISNPFSNNDFELSRSGLYKNPWFNAVSQWRKGRPFNPDHQ